MSYFPLDRKILKSSVYRRGTPVEWKVWTHLMLVADPRDGVVRDAVWLMAQDTNLSVEDFEAALSVFEQPDEWSRTKTDEGRRIRRDGDKILLINYLAHRDKDHSTGRVRSWRERHRTGNGVKRSGTVGNGTKRSETVSNGVERKETPLGTTDTDTMITDTTNGRTYSRADARAPKKTWSKEACDDWIEAFHGTAPGGAIGRHLKPLVEKYTWEVVRPAWRAYLSETDAQYANPARFATATFGTYQAHVPPPPPPKVDLPPREASAEAFFEALKARLDVSKEARATWFRPVFGRCWEGSTLVLTVPTKQFADQMRYFAPKMKVAGEEIGVLDPPLTFRTIVVPVEDGSLLHDGSIR